MAVDALIIRVRNTKLALLAYARLCALAALLLPVRVVRCRRTARMLRPEMVLDTHVHPAMCRAYTVLCLLLGFYQRQ